MQDLLAGLTEAQRAAVTSDGAPLVILAGAGSGKTRVLTRRIAWRVSEATADARHVLALTFTRKAAGELRSRLAQLGVRDQVAAGTFHSIAYAQLRQRWADRGEPQREVLTRKANILRRIHRSERGSNELFDAAAEIEWAKARLITPEQYEAAATLAGRTPPLGTAGMARLFERYEEEKRRQQVVDFDDLVHLCAQALHGDPEFGASQRWRYRHLFVDEFQDVNPAQAALLAGWRGESTDLCVVGDPNQAIYAWNGAEPTYLTRFAQREPAATVVQLDDSFRSTPQIIAVAGSVLGAGAPRLRAHKEHGRLPIVRTFADERAEATSVARSVRDRHRPGAPWSDIAVLARTNAQLVIVAEALRAAQIPHRLRGAAPFLERPAVREALVGMRRAPGSFAERVAWLADWANEERANEERRLDLLELVRVANEYASVFDVPTVDAFGGWLDATFGRDAGDAHVGDGVELATFHASKGLEWPIVLLVGLERGLVPIGRAKTQEAEDEERRLLYVAITRAEDELHCSWARARTFGDRTMRRAPSPWLEDIQAALRAMAEGIAPADLRDRVAEQRAKVRPAPVVTGIVGAGADPEVLDALKAWRRVAAKAAGVPTHVIFHDTTLAAVAEARPIDRDALLRLPGLGPVKAARYGDDLLRVVAEAHAS